MTHSEHNAPTRMLGRGAITDHPLSGIDQTGSAISHVILDLWEFELASLSRFAFISSHISSTDAQCSIQRSQ
jgi:hypothetical protein